MDTGKPKTLHYKRSHFATQLPVDYFYSPSHFWAARQDGDLWRIGLTKFATRMLGEMVDHGFELEAGTPVASVRGQASVVNWEDHRAGTAGHQQAALHYDRRLPRSRKDEFFGKTRGASEPTRPARGPYHERPRK